MQSLKERITHSRITKGVILVMGNFHFAFSYIFPWDITDHYFWRGGKGEDYGQHTQSITYSFKPYTYLMHSITAQSQKSDATSIVKLPQQKLIFNITHKQKNYNNTQHYYTRGIMGWDIIHPTTKPLVVSHTDSVYG